MIKFEFQPVRQILRSHARSIAFAFLLCFACVGFIGAGCSGKPNKSELSGKAAGHNVLFITLDTTRADKIGCYGYTPASTPTLDRLAAKGVLFENAFAQVPLTLPAHASMLTGRYPREHGIRDNGRNGLSEQHPTLATILKKKGYATGAFLAAFVLDKRFGLDRSFDVYSDDMGEVSFETQPLEWQLDGKIVTERALSWLETVKSKPFFAWVHYYDAHDPHVAPEGFARPPGEQPALPKVEPQTAHFMAAYDAEISYLDAHVKQLIDWLEKNQLTQRTLVVIIGDHGESFKEHGELGHTTFVYNTNLQIPFIISHPAVVSTGKRSSALVAQVDVFPTVLELLGETGPDHLISRSLAVALEGKSIEDAEIYSESLYALNSYNWAEQRSLTTPEWKYISSTSPQLFDRKNDPGEMTNLVNSKASITAKLDKALRKKFEAQTAGEGAVVQMDEKALKAMESLGYTGSSRALGKEEYLTAGLPDPAALIHVVTQFRAGLQLLELAKSPEDVKDTLPLLEHVAQQSPNSVYFQHALGTAYLRVQDFEKARRHLQDAIKIDPSYVQASTAMAEALTALGDYAAAEEYFLASFLIQDGATSRAQYGDLLVELGRFEDALAQYKKAIEIFPTFASAHARMGDALRRMGRMDQAFAAYQKAESIKSGLPAATIGLGIMYADQNRIDEAIAKFKQLADTHADHGQAWLNLGKALMTKGDLDAAEESLRRALEIPAVKAEASYGLGVVQSKRGNLADTVRLYEDAIAHKPSFTPPVEELAQHYINSKKPGDAARILEIGAKASPNNAKLLHMLAYVLASGPDGLRDGKRAVELAGRAATLTQFQEPFVLQTLALAQAERGLFDDAMKTIEQGIQLAEKLGRAPLVQSLQDQKAGFAQKRPYRDSRLQTP